MKFLIPPKVTWGSAHTICVPWNNKNIKQITAVMLKTIWYFSVTKLWGKIFRVYTSTQLCSEAIYISKAQNLRFNTSANRLKIVKTISNLIGVFFSFIALIICAVNYIKIKSLYFPTVINFTYSGWTVRIYIYHSEHSNFAAHVLTSLHTFRSCYKRSDLATNVPTSLHTVVIFIWYYNLNLCSQSHQTALTST